MSTIMDACDDAWMAGLFEGEGTIWVGVRSAAVAVTSTDHDVLVTLLNVAGTGQIGGPYHDKRPGTEHYKDFWRWSCRGVPQVQELLTRMSPYLHSRRAARAAQALGLDPLPLHDHRPGRRGGKDPERLCRAGLHPMNGKRYCYACANDLRRPKRRKK